MFRPWCRPGEQTMGSLVYKYNSPSGVAKGMMRIVKLRITLTAPPGLFFYV